MTLSRATKVHLSGRNPLSRGMERECYEHPTDPGLVIKIPLSSRHRKCQANDDELRGYQLLKSDNIPLDFISHCYGYIDTDLGKGLLCDCIRDDNGEVSLTLWDLLIDQDDCDVRYIKKVIQQLCDDLIKYQVWIFDLNLKNIVLRKNRDGFYQPFIIDLKGRSANTELIPLSRYIPYFSLKKLKRRSRQLIERISDYYQRRDELRHVMDN